MPAMGTPPSAERRRDAAVDLARGPDLGQHAGGHAAEAAAARRPTRSVWMLNSIVREALVTSVTCIAPPVSCQTSQVSMVPNASSPASARSRAPGTLSRIQRDLGAGEVGVDHEAGAFADEGFVAVALQAIAEIRGAAVLPDDRVVDRLAGLAVPDDGGLALVGDADGGDVVAADAERRPSASVATAICVRPDLARGRARPSPAAGRSGGTRAGRPRRWPPSWSKTIARELVVPWSRAMQVRHGSDSGSDSRPGTSERTFYTRRDRPPDASGS